MTTTIDMTTTAPTTPTTRAFTSRLRALRDEGQARRRQGRRIRADACRASCERLLRSFEQVEKIEAMVADLARQLVSELPGAARFSHRFYDGGWKLSLYLEEMLRDEQGRPADAFSRLDVHVLSDRERGQLHLSCSTTVREKDGVTERHQVAADDDDLTGAHAWIEARFLDFARAFFGDGRAR